MADSPLLVKSKAFALDIIRVCNEIKHNKRESEGEITKMKLTGDFTIREAVPSDTTAIWRLNCNEMGYQYPLDDTAQNITKLLRSNTDKIFVAVYDGSVIGYVHANDYDLLYAPHMKNIMGIAVSSEHKQQGIGRALLQQVEHWACETGATGVRLVSGASRSDAHKFYHRCGYSGDKEQLNLKKMF